MTSRWTHSSNSQSAFLTVYQDLLEHGHRVSPRGEEILEIEDYQVVFRPYERLSSFVARKLNIAYCAQEFLWYLRADRYDDSITKYATMWKKLKDVDGGFNSNYGQYLFGSRNADGQTQFEWVVSELLQDKDSRRAVIVLLNASHLRRDNIDVVCTYAISFRIRNDELNMSVSMRSNDAIFGLTNDAFCFSMIHEMVYTELMAVGKYPELKLGTYTHKVDSIHVYERHYGMLDELVKQGSRGYYFTRMPRACSPADFSDLRAGIFETSALGLWFAKAIRGIH